ncbi:MAG TPA: glycosyltransferase family 9 protein [Chryseosolibacter sp.]|nr:glycosyltransferase family 9 protein [Chryseosolibacter sp.]
MKKIIVVRFSALGDVALLVPVVRSLVATYQDVEVTVVTRPKTAPLFYDIERVVVFPADVDYTYTGVFGMLELFKTLMKKGRSYEAFIDVHDHIRTMILRTFFRIFGTPVFVFEKGRQEKKAFARKERKITAPLRHTVVRYMQAFEKAGYPFNLLSAPYFSTNEAIETAAAEWLNKNEIIKKERWIGIAPFAMHASKIWPIENYPLVMQHILAQGDVKFFLFGGGEKEVKTLENIQKKFPDNSIVVAGQLKLRQEISIMRRLDLMICIDSANMHFASLSGVPVLSIWGGTHPDVGFSPFGAASDNIVQVSREQLPCRPCSVYGRESCYVGGFPCLTRITPELLADRVEKLLVARQ